MRRRWCPQCGEYAVNPATAVGGLFACANCPWRGDVAVMLAEQALRQRNAPGWQHPILLRWQQDMDFPPFPLD